MAAKPAPRSWPTLYKRTADGATNVWQIRVEPASFGGVIHVAYGREGGKQTHESEEIREGKNLGKANETTPWAQAVLEAEAKWKKRLERGGYGLTVEQSAVARAASPMLAHPIQDHAGKIDWSTAFAQPKLNGFRCLAVVKPSGVELYSRKGKLITALPHIVDALGVFVPGTTLDGELYCHGMTLNKIASAVNRKDPAEHAEQIKYNLYDLIEGYPYAQRHERLERALHGEDSPFLTLVETVVVRSRDDLDVCEATFLEAGYEGAMLRHGRAGYEAGKRSSSLLKVKQFQDDDFPIIDVKEGRGKFKGIAVFVCQTPKGHVFEATAPGSHEEKRAAWDRPEQFIGRLLTVKYAEMTATKEPVPFHPVAIRVRDRTD